MPQASERLAQVGLQRCGGLLQDGDVLLHARQRHVDPIGSYAELPRSLVTDRAMKTDQRSNSQAAFAAQTS